MGTKDFNTLDVIISRWRLSKVRAFIEKGDSVLDFGCGHQAFFLRSVQPLLKVGIGLDYDALNDQLAPNIEILNKTFVDHLDFPDGIFDKIVILAVVEHLAFDLRGRLFDEFNRILRPGGKIILTTPTPAARPLLEFLAFKLKIISSPEIADHKHYYSQADLQSLAAEHRFDFCSYSTFQMGLNCIAVLAKAPQPRRSNN